MKFSEIIQLTELPNYRVAVSLHDVVEQIESFVSKYNLEMVPEFQRGHVWTEDQQVAYVEYLLSGGTSGREIYFNMPYFMDFRDMSKPMVVVDGLQRLTAIQRFFTDEIRVFGLLSSEFEGHLSSRYCLFFNVNDLVSDRAVLKWYLEMNSGGTVHKQEELDRVRGMMERAD